MADLSIRYANALFEISGENRAYDEYLTQATNIIQLLQNPEAMLLLNHPRIKKKEKFAFIQKSFGEDNVLMGFVSLVITKNREAFLLPALQRLVDMIKRHQNKLTAKVTSAQPLTAAQGQLIIKNLSVKLGKQIEMTTEVDPSLIAGLTIQVDDYFADYSVKNMLHDMKMQMNETVRKGASNDIEAR
ncbi:MAG: ATP synthase F1 subunit delta [Defluviitaleaceae bacterium]|nr:ATP synthase F1 subunit delta [Defluviitaleaceae bacterium]